MRWLVFALVAFVYTVALGAEERSIKVTAKSEVKVAPDEAVLELAVHTQDKQLLAAKRENDKIASAVLELTSTHSISATPASASNAPSISLSLKAVVL